MKKTDKQSGFTIIELLIATSIFSVILLVGSMMLLQIGKMYYRGVNSIRTQEVARNVVEDVSRKIQFSGDIVSESLPGNFSGVEVKSYCIGTVRYSVVQNMRVVSSAQDLGAGTINHALWKDANPDSANPGVCNVLNIVDPITTPGEELLSDNMRVAEMCIGLRVDTTPNPDSMCEVLTAELDDQFGGVSINIRVMFGESDLMVFQSGIPVGCGKQSGSQWCASSQLKTQVFKRL